MINVTRLNGKKFVINCELIEFIEETPDTVITFTTGTKVIVRESADELVKEIKKYKKEIYGRDTCVVK
ncbi:flagellar FlbD family protein [Lachnospiraceae bacterium HCP1S3_C3]|nr:flagellar FlbD family protein [Lachnospiraceae bacterium]MDD6857507.1 flagellar FlbD family protein [Lachnospiraceae bacterium]